MFDRILGKLAKAATGLYLVSSILGTTTITNNKKNSDKLPDLKPKTEFKLEDKINQEQVNRRVEILSNMPEFKESYQNMQKKKIPILMFHDISQNKDRYNITPTDFRNLMEDMAKEGFVSLTLDQYVSGDLRGLPVGSQPFVLTFDDAYPGQLQLDYTGKADRNSAVGILDDVAKKYPAFGKGGIYFISWYEDPSVKNYENPFGDANEVKAKLDYLIETGRDIGYHTIFHTNNKNASELDMKRQAVLSYAMMQYHTTKEIDVDELPFAHTFGAKPKDYLAKKEQFESYGVVFDAWGGPAPHPMSEKRDLKAVPRIEAGLNNLVYFRDLKNQYVVTEKDSLFYEKVFGNGSLLDIENLLAKDVDEIPYMRKIEDITKKEIKATKPYRNDVPKKKEKKSIITAITPNQEDYMQSTTLYPKKNIYK